MKTDHNFTVSSLMEFNEVIHFIGESEAEMGTPLWFRGASFSHYDLLPTCYRDRDFKYNQKKTFSEMTLQEEMFYQNFQSQVNHLIGTDPQSKIEWNELFQHHFGQTRMLDWTESDQIALSFALEPFIHPEDKQEWVDKCRTATPTIWILNPVKLNGIVYDFFCDMDRDGIKKAFDEFPNLVFEDIQKELKGSNKEIYFGQDPSSSSSHSGHNIMMNGIFCLYVLETLYNVNLPRLEGMLERCEFNPFFYLIVRFYSDMLPIMVGDTDEFLPPLAIVQPYHSERIRNQRGTFTVFPNYILSGSGKVQMKVKQDPRRMELQTLCEDCIYKIRLLQPELIAKDMIYGGVRYTQLYPELDTYAKTLVMKHLRV